MSRTLVCRISLLLSIAGGCASVEARVVARAARDFSCAPEQTVILDQYGGLYRVSGCGSTASYECQENSSLQVVCTPIEGTQVVATSAAPHD